MTLVPREFELTVKGRTVPGVLFLPERQDGCVPVILLAFQSKSIWKSGRRNPEDLIRIARCQCLRPPGRRKFAARVASGTSRPQRASLFVCRPTTR